MTLKNFILKFSLILFFVKKMKYQNKKSFNYRNRFLFESFFLYVFLILGECEKDFVIFLSAYKKFLFKLFMFLLLEFLFLPSLLRTTRTFIFSATLWKKGFLFGDLEDWFLKKDFGIMASCSFRKIFLLYASFLELFFVFFKKSQVSFSSHVFFDLFWNVFGI